MTILYHGRILSPWLASAKSTWIDGGLIPVASCMKFDSVLNLSCRNAILRGSLAILALVTKDYLTDNKLFQTR